jgi:hypothetical protein
MGLLMLKPKLLVMTSARQLRREAGGAAAGVESGGPEVHLGVAGFRAAATDADQAAVASDTGDPFVDAGDHRGVVRIGRSRARARRAVIAAEVVHVRRHVREIEQGELLGVAIGNRA